MRFGVTWPPGPLDAHGPLVRQTEEAGVDLVGVSDSQAGGYRECYLALGTVVEHTSRALVGPMVTNPVTRHPAVAAAAMSTADERSGGRCIMAISTGDSAVHNIGLAPARLADLEEYIAALRGLFSSEETPYRGASMRLGWARRQVPIYLAAEGPRSLHLAGRIADGVVLGGGVLPEVVDAALERVADGAASAGRTLDELDVWVMSKTAVADSREEAVRGARASLASSANHVFRFTLAGKSLPDELVPAVEELQRRYDVRHHNVPGESNPNATLVDELGLTEYLSRRFGIMGTTEDCVEQLSGLAAHDGVDGVLARPLVDDQRRFLSLWADVLERVRAG